MDVDLSATGLRQKRDAAEKMAKEAYGPERLVLGLFADTFDALAAFFDPQHAAPTAELAQFRIDAKHGELTRRAREHWRSPEAFAQPNPDEPGWGFTVPYHEPYDGVGHDGGIGSDETACLEAAIAAPQDVVDAFLAEKRPDQVRSEPEGGK